MTKPYTALEWSYDMETAPKSKVRSKKRGKQEYPEVDYIHILTASMCGRVLLSTWLPHEGRWERYTKDSPPVAWIDKPEHPIKESTQ
jgi:hypothetical protein